MGYFALSPISVPITTTGLVRQSLFVDQPADVTRNVNAYASLLSQAITTSAGGILIVIFTVAASNTIATQGANFRLQIDAATARATSIVGAVDFADGAALVWRQAVAAGAHTVVIQWQSTNAVNTVQIRPVTAPNSEFASLFVAELST